MVLWCMHMSKLIKFYLSMDSFYMFIYVKNEKWDTKTWEQLVLTCLKGFPGKGGSDPGLVEEKS